MVHHTVEPQGKKITAEKTPERQINKRVGAITDSLKVVNFVFVGGSVSGARFADAGIDEKG